MAVNQRGFSFIEGILVLVVLMGMAGLGYWVLQSNDQKNSASDAPQAAAECGPEWFDTHVHLDDSEFPEQIANQMQANNVSCAVIFAQVSPEDIEEDIELMNEDVGAAQPVFIPFLDVIEDTSTQLTAESLDEIYRKSNGKLKGLGEFALYRNDLADTDLTQEPWPTIYQFAADKQLFVMIHIGNESRHLSALKSVMKEYPETKFLIHGFEQGGAGFAQLLKDNPNMYFTLDTATFLREPGFGKHYMYPQSGGSADQFVADYEANHTKLLASAKQEWTQVIEAAPDRVMWGTDVSFDWHSDQEVYRLLIEFSDDFAESLSEDTRVKYKYQNAIDAFGSEAVVF